MFLPCPRGPSGSSPAPPGPSPEAALCGTRGPSQGAAVLPSRTSDGGGRRGRMAERQVRFRAQTGLPEHEAARPCQPRRPPAQTRTACFWQLPPFAAVPRSPKSFDRLPYDFAKLRSAPTEAPAGRPRRERQGSIPSPPQMSPTQGGSGCLTYQSLPESLYRGGPSSTGASCSPRRTAL